MEEKSAPDQLASDVAMNLYEIHLCAKRILGVGFQEKIKPVCDSLLALSEAQNSDVLTVASESVRRAKNAEIALIIMAAAVELVEHKSRGSN